MTLKEYLAPYGEQPQERIVRIIYSETEKNGHPSSTEVENHYRFRARFDQAVDPASGEMLPRCDFNWLTWLAPKKLLGISSPYHFREGHCYRLLLRPHRDNGETRQNDFYVEKLLEADVEEPLLDPVLQFQAHYEEEEQELLLLIKAPVYGWSERFQFRYPLVRYLGTAEPNSLFAEKCWGDLHWMEPVKGAPRISFQELSVYRVLVRRGKGQPGNLMLVKVLGKGRHPGLLQLAEEYREPVSITNKLGEFHLNRKNSWFEGSVDWLGQPCSVLLDVEEWDTNPVLPLQKLEELLTDLKTFDRQVREFAADELWENAADWCDEGEELSREDFLRRMGSIPDITVDTDGSMELYYDDGEMFAGHVIIVDVDADGSLSSAYIAG